MAGESVQERQKQEIREQIQALQALADRLPESKAEAIARLGELEEKIRVMSGGKTPPDDEGETYMGS